MRTFFFFLFLFWGRSGRGEEGAGECLLDLISRCAAVSSFFFGLCPTAAEVALLCIPTKGLTLSLKQLEPIVELVSN